jgi:hypothetical protein
MYQQGILIKWLLNRSINTLRGRIVSVRYSWCLTGAGGWNSVRLAIRKIADKTTETLIGRCSEPRIGARAFVSRTRFNFMRCL